MTGDLGGADVAPVQGGVRDMFVGVPRESVGRVGGADDPSRAPTFVHPEDGTIVPPNLPGFEVHFRPGRGNDLFEVSFTGTLQTVRVYKHRGDVDGELRTAPGLRPGLPCAERRPR